MIEIKIHETERGSWVVAVNDVWMPGSYISPAIAAEAVSLYEVNPTDFYLMQQRVNHVNMENRLINKNDLNAFRISMRGETE